MTKMRVSEEMIQPPGVRRSPIGQSMRMLMGDHLAGCW